jgi:hypothetical protein
MIQCIGEKIADWIDEPIKTEKEVLSGIVVAPNPADDYIGLQFNNPVDYSKLVIYSSLGQLVQTNLLNGEIYQSISIENLSSGNLHTSISRAAGSIHEVGCELGLIANFLPSWQLQLSPLLVCVKFWQFI